MITSLDTDDDMHALVRSAWSKALPRGRLDPGQTWEGSGANSLHSLRLVLHLEESLGRKVPFDVITREMTTADLAHRLISRIGADRPAAPASFLVPGLFGDEPMLADFRRRVEGRVRFEVVDLPDVDAPLTVLTDLAATGRLLAEQMARRQPEGDILLAGFSVGGSIAFEAAQHLLASGRHVALLCLLDPVPPRNGQVGRRHRRGPIKPASRGPRRSFAAMPGESTADNIQRLVVAALATAGALGLARRLTIELTRRRGAERTIRARRLVLRRSRWLATLRWRPKSLAAPVLLVASDQLAPGVGESWRPLCSRLRIVRVPGRHLELFEPDAMAVIGPALADAFQSVARHRERGPATEAAAQLL